MSLMSLHGHVDLKKHFWHILASTPYEEVRQTDAGDQ